MWEERGGGAEGRRAGRAERRRCNGAGIPAHGRSGPRLGSVMKVRLLLLVLCSYAMHFCSGVPHAAPAFGSCFRVLTAEFDRRAPPETHPQPPRFRASRRRRRGVGRPGSSKLGCLSHVRRRAMACVWPQSSALSLRRLACGFQFRPWPSQRFGALRVSSSGCMRQEGRPAGVFEVVLTSHARPPWTHRMSLDLTSSLLYMLVSSVCVFPGFSRQLAVAIPCCCARWQWCAARRCVGLPSCPPALSCLPMCASSAEDSRHCSLQAFRRDVK